MWSVLDSVVRLAVLAATLIPALAMADPPARVGRLSLTEGSVLLRIDRADAGRPASINWPISSGAILDTDPGARAEVWVGSSTFRLAGAGRVEFATVDDDLIFMQLAVGTLAVTVRDREQAGTIEVRTPEGRVQFERAGRYRIDVAGGRTTVTSRAGSAYLYGSSHTHAVPEGRSAVAEADGGGLYGELPPDGFDAWAAARDAASDAAVARRYVAPEMTGYEDLDRYGDWDSSSEYGVVWYPRHVPGDWAPYRDGHWAWIAPWGWTWIDDAPWGFAPFHYGRWAVIGGRWAWLPGSHGTRPVYSPALVVWMGDAGWNGGHRGNHGPAVGWFPLGPREVFVPPYRHSTPYLHRVNDPHVPSTRVVDKALADHGNRRFIHQSVPQAVTVAPLRTLGEGRPVAGTMIRPDRNELGRQPIASRPPEFPGPSSAQPRREPPPQGQGLPAARQEPPPANPAGTISQAVAPAPQLREIAPPPGASPPRSEPAGSSVPLPAPWRRNAEPPVPAVVPPRPAPAPAPAPAIVPSQPAPMASPPAQAPASPPPMPGMGSRHEQGGRFAEPFDARPRPVPMPAPAPAPVPALAPAAPASMPATVPQRITVPTPAAPPAAMPMPSRDNWRTDNRPAMEAQQRPTGAPPRDMPRFEVPPRGQGGPGDGQPMRPGGRFMPQ